MNKLGKIAIVAALAVVVAVVFVMKKGGSAPAAPTATAPAGLPRLLDLGSVVCIPCKMMAPILEELKKEYAGRLQVEFVDVNVNPEPARRHKIRLIPTQIFFDGSGKERWRHQGFISKEDILAKWKELGVDLAAPAAPAPAAPAVPAGFSRLEPASPDARPAGSICYMCDGDVSDKTRVTLQTDKGDVTFCCPHCFFITYSSLTGGREGIAEKVSVTDWSTGRAVPAATAAFLYGLDATGRPAIKAFADRDAALSQRRAGGGSIVTWRVLQEKELACRCGFCDRAVYPEDSALVKAGGVYTWGCCPMCAMGVAARAQRDIEVHQKDALTGETIKVATTDGRVGSLEPATAVAWAGMKRGPDGKLVSAGCFKQAFFATEANLRKWVEQHPTATGKMIPVSEALAAKMKLTPQQISKACKIGECAPK